MSDENDDGPGALPRLLPIFPLSGALLLPGGRLPLNIFEPRYLNMVQDAMASSRIIGMVQPRRPEEQQPDDHPEIYDTGCAGRITAFSETDDNRILITLTGVSRFDVIEEAPVLNGYRRVVADYAPYRDDETDETAAGGQIDRDRLLLVLRGYFHQRGISADWETIHETPDDKLVTALSMLCPFAPSEKQALLESPDSEERSRVMIALLEMALIGGESDPADQHH